MEWDKVRVKKRVDIPAISEYLEQVIADIAGDQKDNGLALIQAMWPQLVGEKIAKVSSPISLENGVLKLRVRSSVWRQELHSQMSAIIAVIAEKIPETTVVNIIFT